MNNIINKIIKEEILYLLSEGLETKFNLYNINCKMVSNANYNKTEILNQIRAIPNITVVSPSKSRGSEDSLTGLESTNLKIKFITDRLTLQQRIDAIYNSIIQLEGVEQFEYDINSLIQIK